jgi:type II secretory pathway pseudopilin PulG
MWREKLMRFRSLLKNRRPGTSLVEMLLAIIVLALALFSISFSIMLVARNTGGQKDAEKARQLALEVMEECEGVSFVLSKNTPFDSDAYKNAISGMSRGDYPTKSDSRLWATAKVAKVGPQPTVLPGHPPISADILVTVEWGSAVKERNVVELAREVSVSGWQNVGDMSL